MYRKTYVEVDCDNLKYNVSNLIKHYNDYEYYIGVVKGNCYGHGFDTVKCLIESGINYLAVSSIEEALKIREIDKKIPILCLEPIHIDEVDLCIKENITIIIHSYDFYKKIKKLNKKVKIHLKIDSGMNRLGINDKNQVKEIVDNIEIEGIFTHFATSGMRDKYWDNQKERFEEITSLIDLSKIKIVHMGRSMTILNHPKIPYCNGVRLGLIMYGYDYLPSKRNNLRGYLSEIKRKYLNKKRKISETNLERPFEFKTAFTLKSEIIEIKEVKKGQHIGYGAIYEALEDIKVGIIPIGYADGYSRKNKGGFVLIKGKRYPIIDTINMGMTLVKIDDDVKLYDEVVLIGGGISLYEVANRNETTVYEVMCNINDSIPRVMIERG